MAVVIAPHPSEERASTITVESAAQCELSRGLARPLIALSIAYVALCVAVHAGRAWQGDELGSVLALRKSYGELVTHFGGWQTMNFYLAALKAIDGAVGDANWCLVWPGVAAGVWLVWLVARLSLRVGAGSTGAIAAAALAAVNPFLVSYGVTIRSYIFLAAFSCAMVLALFDWKRSGAWRDGVRVGVFGSLALLAHSNALYTYAVVAVLALSWTIVDDRLRAREPIVRLALPVAALEALAAAAYVPELGDMAAFRARWSDTPPIALTFVPSMLTKYFGAGFLVWPALAMLGFATWRAIRDQRESRWLVVAAITALAAISLAGVSHFAWTYSRFLIAMLPWLIVLIADGCAALANRSRAAMIAAVVAIAMTSSIALAAERQRLHEHPWQRAAEELQARIADGSHCVVIHSVGAETAMRAYRVPFERSAAQVLARLPAETTTRLTLVGIPEELAIDASSRSVASFGVIRIASFEGRPREIAASIVQTLSTGANDRVLGDFTDVYKQLGDVLRWTGPPGSAAKYDQLFYTSQAQGVRFRSLPQQFMRDESANAEDS